MARKISGGLVGQPSVGAINVAPTEIMTAAPDQNITISPVGNAVVVMTNNVQLDAQNDLRFADADSSNWVAFQAPATVTSNVTWTLPATDGSNNQVLTTNGAGTLSWTSKDVAIVDQTISATTHYVTLTTSTSGVATTLNTSSTKLSYQPSTGTVTMTALSAGTITETSSITLKENFMPIDDALNKLLQLSGWIYDRKDGSAKREAGLIAEDVDKILPNLVKKDENGNPASIMYTKLTVYLIEALKTLTHEIEQLKGNK
jgi:microcystin-dependent protein